MKLKNGMDIIILSIILVVSIILLIMNPNKVNIDNNIIIENDMNSEQNSQIEQLSKTDLSEENKLEEKEISMQKGGNFLKNGDNIVFYKIDDNKTIYTYNINEKKVEKLAEIEKGVSYMYFDGENVYCMPNYYMGKGIFKIDLQGNVSQIYDGSSLQLWITENEIYFVEQIGFDQINTNPQGTLSVMDKNGENKKEIVTNIKNNFFIANNKIYYTTQDRKMYSVNLDGTKPENITNGRKFTIAVGSNYLLYIDYANQESEHIIKLDTKEDSELGHFGVVYTSQGKTYLNARKRLDDGSIDQNYTLYEILDNGQVVELGNYANFGSKIKYVTDEYIYILNSQNNIDKINLNTKQGSDDNYSEYEYFIGGYAYKVNYENLENITIETLKL